jgi:hypothetical protein
MSALRKHTGPVLGTLFARALASYHEKTKSRPLLNRVLDEGKEQSLTGWTLTHDEITMSRAISLQDDQRTAEI